VGEIVIYAIHELSRLDIEPGAARVRVVACLGIHTSPWSKSAAAFCM
jgi:hypothetical protein